MVDEQEFHHAFLSTDGFFGFGGDFHAVGDRRRTRGERLAGLLHIHQAHAAIGGDRQFFVITETRYINPERIRGIHHGAAFRDVDLFTVDFDMQHASDTHPRSACVRYGARTPSGNAE